MAYTVEINGRDVEFENKPTEADIDEAAKSFGPKKGAADYVKDFGKATASLADTVFGAPAAIGQQIGYGVGRAFGLTPEEATASSLKTTQPFMTPFGSALGITQEPAYQSEATKQIARGIESNVVQPIARATGLPEQDVGSMVNTGLMAAAPATARAGQALGRGVYATEQALGRGAQATGQAAKAIGTGAVDLGRGALRGMAYPAGTAENTALLPIKPGYVPHEQVAEFMAGSRPATSLTELPTSELINQTPGGRWAYGMAPKNAAGERLVPAQGRLMEGIGENIGSGIRTNPLQGIVDLGGLITTGLPIGSAIKAVPAAATGLLQKATQFEPGFVQARNAALAQEGRAGLQAGMPQTPLLTGPAGPVRPGPQPTMYVPPGGAPTTNLAGTEVKYNPPAPQSATFNQVRAAQTPAEVSQQAAAAKIQAPQPLSPEKQAVIDQVRARADAQKAADLAAKQQRWAAAGVRLPRAETPAPVTPAVMPKTPATGLEALRSKLTPQTPEELAAVEAYNALSPRDKAAQTRAQNKAPKDITKMMTEEQLKMWNALKRSDDTNNLLKQLKDSGDPRAKSLAELLEKQGYNQKK